MAGQGALGHRLYGCSPSSYTDSEGQPRLLSIAPGEPSPAGNKRLHKCFLGQVLGLLPYLPSTLFTASLSPIFSPTASIVGVFCKLVMAKTWEAV